MDDSIPSVPFHSKLRGDFFNFVSIGPEPGPAREKASPSSLRARTLLGTRKVSGMCVGFFWKETILRGWFLLDPFMRQ